MTIHHIIAKSLTDNFTNLEANINKKRLRHSRHNWLHCMFGNDPPHKQLLEILEIAKPVITEEAYNDLKSRISMDIYKTMFLK